MTCVAANGCKATLYPYNHRSASCPNSQQFHLRRTVHKNFSSCSCICRRCGLGQAALQLRRSLFWTNPFARRKVESMKKDRLQIESATVCRAMSTSDFTSFRASAIWYWEKRRIFYNLALLLPSLVGYISWSELPAAVNDLRHLATFQVIGLFALSAVAANVCYTFVYALEVLFSGDKLSSRWLRYGRRVAFVSGTLFAMLLAFVGGRKIAMMEY